MEPSGRQLFAVAAAFVATAGIVWLVLSVLLAVAAVGVGSGLREEVLRVGGPPAVVALVAGALAAWARR